MFTSKFDHADAKYYVYFNDERLDKLGGFTHPRYVTAAIEQLEKELKDGKSKPDKSSKDTKLSKKDIPKTEETE